MPADFSDILRQLAPSGYDARIGDTIDSLGRLQTARAEHANWEPEPVHEVLQYVPFVRSVHNWRIERDYGNAMRRLHQNQATADDYEHIAQVERHRQLQQNQGIGRIANDTAASVVATLGEAYMGGRALGAVGGMNIPGISSSLRWLGFGGEAAAQTVGAASRLGQIGTSVGRFAGHTAAQTAVMPSMYLEQWARNNEEQGRDPLDIRGLGSAFVVGMANTAILGSIGRQGNAMVPGKDFVSTMKRLGMAGPIGLLETQIVDTMQIAAGWKTGYGTVGDVLAGKDDALKHALLTAVTFTAFAGMHEAQSALQPRQQPTPIEQAVEQARTMAAQGESRESVGEVIGRTTGQRAQQADAEQRAAQGPEPGIDRISGQQVQQADAQQRDAQGVAPPAMARARQFLDSLNGGVPIGVSRGMESIANDLGIEVKSSDRPSEVIEKIKQAVDAYRYAPQNQNLPKLPEQAINSEPPGVAPQTRGPEMAPTPTHPSPEAQAQAAGVPSVAPEPTVQQSTPAAKPEPMPSAARKTQPSLSDAFTKAGLKGPEKQVVMERYVNKRTLSDIAEDMGVSVARVGQIEQSARAKLKMIGVELPSAAEFNKASGKADVKSTQEGETDTALIERAYKAVEGKSSLELTDVAKKLGIPFDEAEPAKKLREKVIDYLDRHEAEQATQQQAPEFGEVTGNPNAEPMPPDEYRAAGGTHGEGPLIPTGPNKTTAMSHEKIAETRQNEGLAEIEKQASQGDEQLWMKARELERLDPGSAYRLAQEVVATKGKRALNAEESARILHGSIVVRNKLANAIKDSQNPSAKTMDDMSFMRLQKQVNDLVVERQTFDEAAHWAGSEKGRALRLQRLLAKYDYTLNGLLGQAQAAKGKEPLTAAETKTVTDLHNTIADLQKKLDEAEARASAQGARVTDEVSKLRSQIKTARQQFDAHVQDWRDANKSTVAKVWGTTQDALDFARASRTTLDVSGIGRQGGLAALSHPVITAKAAIEAGKATVSKEASAEHYQKILDRPNGESGLYQKSGLMEALPESNVVTHQEEFYRSKWASKIPLIREAERFHSNFLAQLRADLFDHLADSAASRGKLDDATAKGIANYVKAVTGYGKLPGMLDRSTRELSWVLFSPRNLASRVQLLIGEPVWNAGSAEARKIVAKEYAKVLMGAGLVYLTARVLGDDKTMTGDPRSSDFGKIRIGDVRLDPIAGMSQAIILTARGVSGSSVNEMGGVVPLRGEEARSRDFFSAVADYGRGKLAPLPGAAISLMAGRQLGDPQYGMPQFGRDLVMPMIIGDIRDTLRAEMGVPARAATAMAAILGWGVRNHQADEPVQEFHRRLGILKQARASTPIGQPFAHEREYRILSHFAHPMQELQNAAEGRVHVGGRTGVLQAPPAERANELRQRQQELARRALEAVK